MDTHETIKMVKVGLAIGLIVVAIASLQGLFEHVTAGENLVVQSVFGNMTVYTDPGYKWQGFGRVTHYKKSFQYWFSSKADQGNASDQSIKIRFNDGGHGNVSGSVRVDLPLAQKELLDIHTTFGSQEAVEQQLIRPVFEKSVYMTGPVLSSKESYAEKRNDMLQFIEDQAIHGVYQTASKEIDTKDQITGETKRAVVVEIRRDVTGNVLRQEDSPLSRFGVRVYNLSINEIKYDDAVEKQIAAQQEATMQVQTARANALKAEQDSITTAKQGEASAVKTKWEQEQINSKLIAEAEGRKRAAQLDKEAAEFTKQKDILLGQGEAEKQRLLMEANGALDPKLKAYQEVNKYWADAFTKIQVPVVPSIIMGGQSGGNPNSVQSLIDMLQVKTAKELSLDLNVETKKTQAK